ncbi:MAG: spore cortex biosynthesis protein YabQ [Clostridia bacterium]|nr:spore cortex biosynthesis protein YabQ [Clostridia bacterium]
MEATFGVKLGYFLWSLALGGGLAFVYDVLRSGRRIAKNSVIRVNLEDMVFFLLAGVLLFFLAYDKNGGRLRWQGFLGTVLGVSIYYLIFRDSVVRAMVWVSQALMTLVLWLVKIFLFPVCIVYRILAKPFLIIGWYSKKGASKAGGIIKTKRQQMRLRAKTRKFSKSNRKKRLAEKKKTSEKTGRKGGSKLERKKKSCSVKIDMLQ